MIKIMRTTAAILGLFTLTASASIIDIYHETFHGFTASLNGWAPTIRPGTETWVTRTSTAYFQRSGNIFGSGTSNAALPFTPQQGNVYLLSVDIDVTSTTAGWIAAGFSQKQTVGAHAHSWTDVNGYAWSYLAGNEAGPRPVAGAAGTGISAQLSGVDLSDFITVKITLDTTNASSSLWTASWEVTDKNGITKTAGPTLANTGNYDQIRYVGISHANGATGVVDNFRLQIIPEPASVGLAGLGIAIVLWRRRIRRA